MSFSRHSCSVYLGLPNGSSGTVKCSSRLRPVKSEMGEISEKSCLRPSRLNQSKESSWILIRFCMAKISGLLASDIRVGNGVARESIVVAASAMYDVSPQIKTKKRQLRN